MADKLPLVVYKDGKRIVIGEAELHGDHVSVTMDTASEEGIAVGRKLLGLDEAFHGLSIGELSIGEDVAPKRRNVFEQDKD